MTQRGDQSRSESTDEATLYSLLFVEIDRGEGVASSERWIRLVSDNVERYLNRQRCIPVGAILSIDPIDDVEGIAAKEIRISMANDNEDLRRAALKADLRGSYLHLALAVDNNAGALDRTYASTSDNLDQVTTLFEGRIGAVAVGGGKVEVTAYTPMTDMTSTHRFAQRWSDEQQQQFVDSTDKFFRYTTANSVKEIVY